MGVIDAKIALVGTAGSGKSALVSRHVRDISPAEYSTTPGVQFSSKTYTSKDDNQQAQDLNLHIWDVGGQERYAALMSQNLVGASVVVIVVDLSENINESIEALKKYYNQIFNSNNTEQTTIVIVGAKSDLVLVDQLTEKEHALRSFATERGCEYYTTSAKNGSGVQEVFDKISSWIFKKNVSDKAHANNKEINVTPKSCAELCDDYINSFGLNKSPQSIALALTIKDFCRSKIGLNEDDKKLLYFIMKPYMETYGHEKEFAKNYIGDIYEHIKPHEQSNNQSSFDKFYAEQINQITLKKYLFKLIRRISDQYENGLFNFNKSDESLTLCSKLKNFDLVSVNLPGAEVTSPILNAFNKVVNKEVRSTLKSNLKFIVDDRQTSNLLSHQ